MRAFDGLEYLPRRLRVAVRQSQDLTVDPLDGLVGKVDVMRQSWRFVAWRASALQVGEMGSRGIDQRNRIVRREVGTNGDVGLHHSADPVEVELFGAPFQIQFGELPSA